MEVCEVVALWHLELLPGLVTLLLSTFRSKEDGGNRQHGDDDLQGRGRERGGESRHLFLSIIFLARAEKN
jgi:hypothetical protein